MLKGVVEKVDDEVAVIQLLDGNQLVVRRDCLPKEIRQGNVIDVIFSIDERAEQEQRRKVADLRQALDEQQEG